MCSIFRFLDYQGWFGDLFHCSLVNSHWLFHTWNPNCKYYNDLTNLIFKTQQQCNINSDNRCTRTWQRVVNAKYIRFRLVNKHEIKNNLIVNRLAMLDTVEQIDGQCIARKHLPMLKIILHKNHRKIRRFELRSTTIEIIKSKIHFD